MLFFTLSKINLQEKSCSEGMENKRVHDLYCSLIFKGASHTVIKCFLMCQGIQAAPCDWVHSSNISPLPFPVQWPSRGPMGQGQASSGWRLEKHFPPPQDFSPTSVVPVRRVHFHPYPRWRQSSPWGNVMSSGLPSITEFSGKISHIGQLCPPEIQTFERAQNYHELSWKAFREMLYTDQISRITCISFYVCCTSAIHRKPLSFVLMVTNVSTEYLSKVEYSGANWKYYM